MKALEPDLDLDTFFRRVASSSKRLLLLDYDGTLAPFRIIREEAAPYPGVRELLKTLQQNSGTRIVLVTGRSIDTLLPLLALDPPPEIWGSHGWERLTPERGYEPAPLEDRTVAALDEARGVLEKAELVGRSEMKHGCLALHWRGLEPSEAWEVRDRVLEHWERIVKGSDLYIVEFDGGLELRARGKSKATVTRTLLSEMGDDTICAFLGDDVTDEDAFRELSGDHLGVLVRMEYRPTGARLWIRPPGELLEFLERWVEAGRQPMDQAMSGKGERP